MVLFRTSDIVMVVLILCFAFATYSIKSDVQRRSQEVRLLQRKIESEQDIANILRARWALATDPARIARLVQTYSADMQLQDIDPRQVVTVDKIPQRLPDAIEMVIKESDAVFLAQSAPDKTATGSVNKDNRKDNGGERPPQASETLTAAPLPPEQQGAKQAILFKSGKQEEQRQKTRNKQPPWSVPAHREHSASAGYEGAVNLGKAGSIGGNGQNLIKGGTRSGGAAL